MIEYLLTELGLTGRENIWLSSISEHYFVDTEILFRHENHRRVTCDYSSPN